MKGSHEQDQIIKYIKEFRLGDILPESCHKILKIRTFETYELIVEEATDVAHLDVLVEGKCRVSPTSSEGKVALLDFVVKGDVIGDMEYFSKDQYYYNVTALVPCTTLAIPVRYIDQYFHENINFYKYFCENMASKMKRTSSKYSKNLLYPIKNQVANYFYEIYKKNSQMVIPIVFKEVSAFFDITPRYFRSILVELEEEGILSRETNGINLLDVEKLKAYSP